MMPLRRRPMNCLSEQADAHVRQIARRAIVVVLVAGRFAGAPLCPKANP